MTYDLSKFYTKNGIAAQKIAQQLLAIREGERIPRIDDFVQELKLGRGTIQGSLNLLEETKAIRLEPRGHLGTFLVMKNNKILWQIAGNGSLVGVMPLPYSRKYEGLATGFAEVFKQSEIPFNMAYMRGAENRIKALLQKRADFAIVSRGAAESSCHRHPELHILKTLGKGTFVNKHGILFSDKTKKRIENGMKVGIDETSFDQKKLTLYECEELDVQFISVHYTQMFTLLNHGKIDAAVWNLDEIHLHPELGVSDFQSEKALQLVGVISETAVLIHKENKHVKHVLEELPFSNIIEIQMLVEQGKKLPHY